MRGFDIEKMEVFHVTAQVKEMEVTAEEVREAINIAIEKAKQNGTEKADVSPVGPNQKPRMLQLTSWICHAGPPNLNRAAFLEQDLSEAVNAGLFQPPFFGMIDFNHDFNSYGAWFKAQYKFDESCGQWGILAEGAIFAWRYEALADKLLAMQARQGHIDVSMACMPISREIAKEPNGASYVILRKPVFFTTSVLDVDPADPNARALGTEKVNQPSSEREAELLKATENTSPEKEKGMENQNKPEAKVEETPVAVAEVKVEESVETPAVAVATEEKKETPAPATSEKKEEVTVETPAADVAALQTENQTLTVALEAAKGQIETLNAELTALREFKAAKDAEVEATKKEQVRTARMAEIPEAVREEMASEENKTLLEQWMSMDDTAWAATLKVLVKASAAVAPETRATKTEKEGTLSTASDKEKGEFAISRWKRK